MSQKTERTDGGYRADTGGVEQREQYVRRKFLQGLGGLVGLGVLGMAGKAAFDSDIDNDGLRTGEELQGRTSFNDRYSGAGAMPDGLRVKYDLPMDRSYSETEASALALADRRYESSVNTILEFMHDDTVNAGFVETQLGYWTRLPESWQGSIISHDAWNAFYMDDWNKNGIPHILPDGSKGPDFDALEPVNPDHDAFMPAFYNHTGKVRDVTTGEYLGFQPGQGDRVGKLGDRNGDGSIAAYLDGDVAPDELVGRKMSVVWFDWMEGYSEELGAAYSMKPSQECLDTIDRILGRAPVENDDGTAGVYFYSIMGGPVQHQERGVAESPQQIYREHVPLPLQGPVNHGMYIHQLDEKNRVGIGISGEDWHGGLVGFPSLFRHPQVAGGVMVHELYGHMIGGLGHAPAELDSIMSSGGGLTRYDSSVNFTQGEWTGNVEYEGFVGSNGVIPGMDVVNRTIALEGTSIYGEGGFYDDWPPLGEE